LPSVLCEIILCPWSLGSGFFYLRLTPALTPRWIPAIPSLNDRQAIFPVPWEPWSSPSSSLLQQTSFLFSSCRSLSLPFSSIGVPRFAAACSRTFSFLLRPPTPPPLAHLPRSPPSCFRATSHEVKIKGDLKPPGGPSRDLSFSSSPSMSFLATRPFFRLWRIPEKRADLSSFPLHLTCGNDL